MAPMPQLQRRYSVTGQTPPDNEVPKQQHSPKLQALDTSVQSTPSCGLCESGADTAKAGLQHEEHVETQADGTRGRKISHHTTARMVSKRSATQLPSPNTPTTHELPPKIAKLGLETPDMDVGVDVDEGVFTDHFCEAGTTDFDHLKVAPSPYNPSSYLPDADADADEPIIESFDLDTQYDSGVESLALTPIASPTDTAIHIPTTLLTLPPELRHQIYLHLPDLVLPYPLIYCLSTFNNNMQHPLASVSRLIRQEALAIFYSYNTWIIKLEFKMMYEAFQDWIIRLGDGAGMLRLVTIAVRGKLFKPRTSHASHSIAGVNGNANGNANGQVPLLPGMPAYALVVEQYSPPDGDASFSIDLSEKYTGGKVVLVRNDGTKEAGEQAAAWLQKNVAGIWEKRQVGTLNGQDWVDFVDEFLAFAGWW
ncbi:hypothetical protein BU23DRAFT_545085 [Bimuria novae-zelandiae CBS 107.79]|uniref:F-box domain-containing protein n=1 Tax=Bimuria novae-zelandiae CBS 107.79 TaxID=1447943 RepID=A0A6A5UNR8_9PLEO|nr:hypothetical protein BU23DRAFT_545085 [Bimuria novae-zelandiae CBS 107.79]